MTITGASGESNLFGTASEKYSNFTEYGWDNNDVHGDGIGYDDTGSPLRLQWVIVEGPPGFDPYPRPNCG